MGCPRTVDVGHRALLDPSEAQARPPARRAVAPPQGVEDNRTVERGERFAPAQPLRRLAYRALWAMADGFQKAADACVCLATGLLTRRDLRAVGQLRWDCFARMNDDVDAGLDPWERRVYGTWLRPADRVLLVGCGTGRDLVGLIELGCRVTGLDPAPTAVRRARQHLARRNLTAEVLCGFVEDAPLEAAYEAVVFSPTAYANVPQAANRIATLKRLRDHLATGGRLLLTYAERTDHPRRSLKLLRLATRLAGADWHPEPGDIAERDPYDRRLPSFEHRFTPEEIARECGAAGFDVLSDELVGGALRCLVARPAP